MLNQSLQAELQKKQLELNSLFETIGAINANSSEKDLYKIFRFIISANNNISKMALYVLDEKWHCKENFGSDYVHQDLELEHPLPEILNNPTSTERMHFTEFDSSIPVKHKNKILAYVFLGLSEKNILRVEIKTDFDFIEALANIIIVAIENKKLFRKEQKRVLEMEFARDMQSFLFPQKVPYNDKLKVIADYLPLHSIGGDYYDFIEINSDKFLICIADVSGKGIPAALLMSNFQASLRVLLKSSSYFKGVVNELNKFVLQNSRSQHFVTAFFAIYDLKKKNLRYINAGHNPPFLFANNYYLRLKEGTTMLGSLDELPMLEEKQINNLDNFYIFCFTDGLTETENENGEYFEEKNLKDFLSKNKNTDPKVLHRNLIEILNNFKGNNAYADDITLLSCKITT